MGWKHGLRHSPTYESWGHMLQRCTNPKATQFKYYGGRGITVDARWYKFENFLLDMGERPDGTTLSRIDNDGPYNKSNCEWADRWTQGRNKRNTRWVEYQGESMPLSKFAKAIDINRNALFNRLRQGWTLQEIVNHYSDPKNWRKVHKKRKEGAF